MKKPIFYIFIIAIIGIGILPAAAAGIPFNESIPGDRNLDQVFSWSIWNVSKQADIIYHYTVYDYRIIGRNYTYYSPAWGSWFVQESRPGYQYLAVWVRGWSDGTTGWGYGPDRFRAWVWGNRTISPEPVHLNDLRIRLGSDRYRPVVIRELEGRPTEAGKPVATEWYGWKDGRELERMESGISNAWDGLILYQIPAAAGSADIRIAGWFGSYYGTAIWYLTEREILQDSPEVWQQRQREILVSEIKESIRLGDNPGRDRV